MLICWLSKIVLLLISWSTLSPMLAAPILPIEDINGYQRSERSANLSHITGTARKIRMYVKNRYLKISGDGNVTGINDDESEYTILQRSSVNTGQVKIQGVATCMFLCMDTCGLLYGSREYDDECVFNEMIEQHHYNTYSSAKYSNDRRTLYLALNKHGIPRRVQLRNKAPLGKMSLYTRVLTQPVSNKKVEKIEKQPPMRHHHICPPIDDKEKRRKRNRKKKRKKCGENNNQEAVSPNPAEEDQKKVSKRKSGELVENHRKRKPNENKEKLKYKEVTSHHSKSQRHNTPHQPPPSIVVENTTLLPIEENTIHPDLDVFDVHDEMT